MSYDIPPAKPNPSASVQVGDEQLVVHLTGLTLDPTLREQIKAHPAHRLNPQETQTAIGTKGIVPPGKYTKRAPREQLTGDSTALLHVVINTIDAGLNDSRADVVSVHVGNDMKMWGASEAIVKVDRRHLKDADGLAEALRDALAQKSVMTR